MIKIIIASIIVVLMTIVALFIAGIYAMCKAICYFQEVIIDGDT